MKPSLKGLIRQLVLDELIPEDVAAQVVASKEPLVPYLITHKLITPHALAQTISSTFCVPFYDLQTYDFSPKILSEQLISQYKVLPLFRQENCLQLAMIDPGDQSAIDEVKFYTGLDVQPVVVESDKLFKLIDQLLDEQEKCLEDDQIIRFVEHILLDAMKRKASDIHFEPYDETYRIRFRLDGVLYPIATPAVTFGRRIAARLKVMAELDVADRRIPQDGRFKLENHAIDFRVSTCPTIHGEKIVVRLLDSTTMLTDIDALGFEPFQKELFLKAIQQSQGMILVTGPTGSGKTVSLYTALCILNTPEVNISTVEDPVEIYLPGINQVNINIKTGLTFATALRAFLRQDPDIIMVGEMRDAETVDIGIKAAQTGHLV